MKLASVRNYVANNPHATHSEVIDYITSNCDNPKLFRSLTMYGIAILAEAYHSNGNLQECDRLIALLRIDYMKGN